MKETIKFENVSIYVTGANGEQFLYHENNEYKNTSKEDIIYYHEAMKYLLREDTSLCESLEIASEYGYTTENLNSELLATLLYQQNLTNQWYEISEQIEQIFNN